MNSIRSIVRRYPFGAFLFLAFLLLVLSLPLAFSAPDLLPLVLSIWPALAALVLAALAGGRPEVRALFARMARWRVRPVWYAAALGIPLLGTLLMVALALALGSPDALKIGYFMAALVLFSFIFNALEEFGWRAHVLPGLLRRLSPLAAGLVVGLFWSLYHLPLHLPGNWYAGYPVLPTILILIGYSVLATWIFVNARRSALLTTLFHGTLNVLTPLTAGVDPMQAWWLRALVFFILAVVVVALAGPAFRRQPEASPESVPVAG